MTLNSFTQRPMAAGILDTWTSPRATGSIQTAGTTARWPWPLPVDSVLAVFDDAAALPAVVASLRRNGVPAENLWTVAGAKGAAALHDAFTRRGTLSRLRSQFDSEDEIVAHLIERTTRGGAAILVRRSNQDRSAIADLALQHGARLIRRTGRWLSAWEARGA